MKKPGGLPIIAILPASLRQLRAGFTSCGVAVKAEEHFSGVLAFRNETVKGFARNAAQGKIASIFPVLRVKADKGQKVNRCFKDKELVAVALVSERIGLAAPPVLSCHTYRSLSSEKCWDSKNDGRPVQSSRRFPYAIRCFSVPQGWVSYCHRILISFRAFRDSPQETQ